MNKVEPLSDEQNDFIRENAGKKSRRQIAEELETTVYLVEQSMEQMGLKDVRMKPINHNNKIDYFEEISKGNMMMGCFGFEMLPFKYENA